MIEKRAHVRKLMVVDASVGDASGTAWHPILLLDVSPLGATFASAQVMESGAVHLLRFCLPGSARRHEAVVKIVHSSNTMPSGYRGGAKFVAIDTATSLGIAEFIRANPSS